MDSPSTTLPRTAWGQGLATVTIPEILGTSVPVTLDVWYPNPYLGPVGEQLPPMDRGLTALAGRDPARGVETVPVLTVSLLDEPPVDTADAYLRLHLLSHRLVVPNSINLTGLYQALETVVWTAAGPCSIANFEATRARLRARTGWAPNVRAVDRFPRMVDYIVPDAVRITDADRVRLGAYLAPGTTVLHEGFVNVNSGTLGAAVIDGRLAAGVVVHGGANLGGGSATIPVTAGPVAVGARTLLGPQSGTGVTLGADCVVEPGLHLTAGSTVQLVGITNADGTPRRVKARELAGAPGLMFRRNSVTGAVEARTRASVGPSQTVVS